MSEHGLGNRPLCLEAVRTLKSFGKPIPIDLLGKKAGINHAAVTKLLEPLIANGTLKMEGDGVAIG